MREIKFRAWDRMDEVMRDWHNLTHTRYAKRGDTIFNDEGYILMQYTGMKDVYAGDRCRVTACGYYSNISLVILEGNTFEGVVKMVYYTWMIVAEDKTYIPLSAIEYYGMKFEVIGNIYEGNHDKD